MAEWIGITLGDVTGIGPEVTLKALAASLPSERAHYVLIGDAARLHQLNRELELHLELGMWHGGSPEGHLLIHQPFPDALPAELAAGSPVAARAALAWLRAGARLCLHQQLDALVTAPLNKEAILRTGEAFVGQTEFLSHLAGTDRTAMMLLGQDDHSRWLRVALATTHLPLRQVADHLSQAKIERVIELAAQACRDLGLERTRVAVCGLNPHAGEGGMMGDEELRLIAPAVRNCRGRGLDAVGPLAADTVFHSAYRDEYDAVVAMYHDQGLAPLKLVAFDTGVNWTLGLPFIRTSPDHGTAYDIAGRGVANPSSMLAALRLARQLVARREFTRRLRENHAVEPPPPAPGG
jgi:4-hydroxythreonine-4-phosphate dehydrogenase